MCSKLDRACASGSSRGEPGGIPLVTASKVWLVVQLLTKGLECSLPRKWLNPLLVLSVTLEMCDEQDKSLTELTGVCNLETWIAKHHNTTQKRPEHIPSRRVFFFTPSLK